MLYNLKFKLYFPEINSEMLINFYSYYVAYLAIMLFNFFYIYQLTKNSFLNNDK